MNYFSAGRFLPVGLFTTLDLSPSVTILRWLEILWSSPRINPVASFKDNIAVAKKHVLNP